MEIKTRFSVSADGYVTTPDGWPPLIADPNFVSGKSHAGSIVRHLQPAHATAARLQQ
jgi:hypothetical protein